MKSDQQKEADNELVISYLTLRNLIGILGMLLPVVLVIITNLSGDPDYWKPSISDYYYTRSGDVLVVILSTLAVFLLTYTGYQWQENAWTCAAALGAIGVAFSPTSIEEADSLSVHLARTEGVLVHFLSAALLFISLAVMCLHYFTRTDKPASLKTTGKMTQKAKRNRVYKICGWTIIGCIIGLGVFFLGQKIGLFPKQDRLYDFPVVLFLETVAVEAFGFAWLTKGETLWPDGESYMMKLVQSIYKTE